MTFIKSPELLIKRQRLKGLGASVETLKGAESAPSETSDEQGVLQLRLAIDGEFWAFFFVCPLLFPLTFRPIQNRIFFFNFKTMAQRNRPIVMCFSPASLVAKMAFSGGEIVVALNKTHKSASCLVLSLPSPVKPWCPY